MPRRPQSSSAPPRARRVGLKDVARACGLSMMTVSRALKNVYGVNPATRQLVMQKAAELGYVPNVVAASLAGQRTHTVGVIIPDIDHSIFPAIVKGLETLLSAQGYRLFLCCTYDNPGKEYQEVMALLERQVDGIILAPASLTQSGEAVGKILSHGCPLVLMDRALPEQSIDSVVFDDFEGARGAVRHLIEQGYTQIAHIAGPADIWTGRERQRGFEQAMREAGLELAPESIVRGGLTVADGAAGMERLLGRAPLPQAVFCVNDPTAIGAYKTLRKHGLSVPAHMGLVGFSDTLEAEIMEVPLTTVVQDVALMGQQAATLLLARMSGANASQPPIAQVIKTHLAVRRSARRRAE